MEDAARCSLLDTRAHLSSTRAAVSQIIKCVARGAAHKATVVTDFSSESIIAALFFATWLEMVDSSVSVDEATAF